MAEKQLAYRASGNDGFFAEDDPLAELARIVGFEPRPAAQAAPAAHRQEPAFNLEDELLREFERYDTPRMSPANDVSAPAAQVPSVEQGQASRPAEPVRAEPVFEAPPQPVAPAKPIMGARDLIDELEMSIAPALQPVVQPAPQAAVVEPPVAPPVVKTPQSAAATVRLPLANFTLASASREQPAPAVVSPVAPQAPNAASVEAMFEDMAVDFAPVEVAKPAYEPQLVAAAQPAPAVAQVPEPAKSPNVDAAALSAEIDALLADVDRYPVPSRASAPAEKAEPIFGNFGPAVTEYPAEPVAAPQHHEEPNPITFGAEDPFAGQDFEFDLADIEMELAELDFAEAEKSAVARQPAPSASFVEPVVSRATPVAPAPVAPASVAAVAPQPIPAAPVDVPAARSAAPMFDADQLLPFDPTEISDTEERVETFEGSHVPHLPVIEPEEPIAVPPEYDFDIDSEMASLLGTPAKEAAPEAVKSAAAAALGVAVTAAASSWSKNAAAQPAAAVAKQPIEEFDEFERALEEDFRRSYREASSPVENVARMTLNPAAGSRRPVRSVRGMVTAAAVIAVLGAGAYGAYSWVRHGAPISTFSGEPRVITADADPVKVAPENPGGTVVPNQDKAVYDRVAGDSTAAPKQKELVSSNEQPVDVVQKTLIPESISPDDGSGDQVTPTAVGETQDPRLLPNQNGGNTNVAANGDDQVPAVSPRKVRTMIVKPDGSLVARDDTAPAAADKPAPAAAKPAANNQVASANARPAPANTQAAAQPNNGDAASAESTPIRVVKTNPVPTTRPEPAKAATPAPAQEAQPKPQPKQVASAAPAAASAASGGAYGVQIASLPTEADAQKSQANLKIKFASVIGNHPLEIRKAEIAGKGTYYRVRVVAGTKDEAAAICERYRAAGGTCLISK
ncbi:SPOR domain-containing protein [Rhizobium miluonense]|uniref:Sporulation related domain-containing protein n=1 Tax=Rhizobium miluonense TaxID=411945 RepID=A0A1C3UM30_9HYPH|nr:SPOR domain-containing protein [Rhizobium miluonense]SCB16543.1 Sporulation related domain-containing protein [Rhizobium miluonense]